MEAKVDLRSWRLTGTLPKGTTESAMEKHLKAKKKDPAWKDFQFCAAPHWKGGSERDGWEIYARNKKPMMKRVTLFR